MQCFHVEIELNQTKQKVDHREVQRFKVELYLPIELRGNMTKYK